MAREEVIRTLLSAKLLETNPDSDGNTGNVALKYILAPMLPEVLNGLLARQHANTFGSGVAGGGVEYTRKVKDIVLSDFTDTDGQPVKDDGTLNTDLKFKIQTVQKVLIRTDIELTIEEKEKIFDEDIQDTQLVNMVSLVMSDIMEAYELDLQLRRDDLLKITATANGHLLGYDWGSDTTAFDGAIIYKAIQNVIISASRQGQPDGEANPFHIGINKSKLVVEVSTYVAVALQNYLAFTTTKLNKDEHIFTGKFDSLTKGANSVIVGENTFIGQIAGVNVFENKLLGRDNNPSTQEDYFVVFPIAGQGAYGLPFRDLKTKMGYITNYSFYRAINTLFRYGIGAIRPETIYMGVKEIAVPPAMAGKPVAINKISKTLLPLNIGDDNAKRMISRAMDLQKNINSIMKNYKGRSKNQNIDLGTLIQSIQETGAKDNKNPVHNLQNELNKQSLENKNTENAVSKTKNIKEKLNI